MKPTITPEQVREWITEENEKEDLYAFSELQDYAVQLAQSWLRQAEALEVAKEALKSFGPEMIINVENGIICNTAIVNIDEVRKLHIALSRIDAIMKVGE